jgi:hypothetical protein
VDEMDRGGRVLFKNSTGSNVEVVNWWKGSSWIDVSMVDGELSCKTRAGMMSVYKECVGW